MRTFIHIGLDKCGSSSLQQYFSENGYFKTSQNKLLEYKCLTKNGVLNGNQVKELSNKEPCGYLSSLGLKKLEEFNSKKFDDLKFKNDVDNDLIYSCEGWYRGLKQKNLFLNLFKFLEGSIQRELIFIAFLRAPVMWINSAWWQWGAWENQNINDFEKWLEKSTVNCCWFRYFSEFQKFQKKYKLVLKPLTNKLIPDLENILEINGKYKPPNIVNKSLPIEVLKLYLEYPFFRPNSHENKFDNIFSKLISQSNIKPYKTPWILSNENIKFILNKTQKSNEEVIKLMKSEDQKYILNDPSWWDIDYYKKMIKYDPFLKDFEINTNLLELFSTLLIKNYKEV